MRNYKQDGHVLTAPAPAAVASGDVVLLGDLIGVAIIDAGSGEDCSFQVSGVIEGVAKATGQAWDVGDLLAYDTVNDRFTATTDTLLACAHAAAEAASADTTGDVLLGVRGVTVTAPQ